MPTQPASRFGTVPGHPPGSTYPTRAAVRLAGLHRHDIAGISGNYEQGTDAIVVSGGYVDDQDEGDRIIYTGQGGQDAKKRQVRDQTLTKGNLALALSEEAGLPVRVIRGASGAPDHSPPAGYRYDGLYTVTSHWQEPSRDGPLIWRFILEKAPEVLWESPASSAAPPPPGTHSPAHTQSVVQRVIRNSAVAQWVKGIHGHACQICLKVLRTPAGPYAEGAHIRPLGHPHLGPDVPGNVLCLCPNHHVLLDKGAIYIADGQAYLTENAIPFADLATHPRHVIDWTHAEYHRAAFASKPA